VLALPRGRRHATAGATSLPPAGAPLAALLVWGLAWAALAVAPADRAGWWLESLLPLSLVALLVGTWRYWPLSAPAYGCTAAFLVLHAVGAHYGYPHAPPGEWLRAAFHAAGWATTRNPYDRVVHFAFGALLVLPLGDALARVTWRRSAAAVLAVVAVLALGGVYEVFEWGAARLLAPDLGLAFVGAQGDPWDAQQDIALAGVGSVLTLAVRALWRRRAAARRA
jgi:putative membrane protein